MSFNDASKLLPAQCQPCRENDTTKIAKFTNWTKSCQMFQKQLVRRQQDSMNERSNMILFKSWFLLCHHFYEISLKVSS